MTSNTGVSRAMGAPGHSSSSVRLAACAFLGTMLVLAASGAAGAERQDDHTAQKSDSLPPVNVVIDRAKVVRLPERTQTVIVGNPIIADVTVQKNGILIVTGKTFGTTNLIALDGAGGLLAESMVRVQAPSDSIVTVQRGLDRETYSCTPNCQPSLQLGDANSYFDQVGGQAGKRNGLATAK